MKRQSISKCLFGNSKKYSRIVAKLKHAARTHFGNFDGNLICAFRYQLLRYEFLSLKWKTWYMILQQRKWNRIMMYNNDSMVQKCMNHRIIHDFGIVIIGTIWNCLSLWVTFERLKHKQNCVPVKPFDRTIQIIIASYSCISSRRRRRVCIGVLSTLDSRSRNISSSVMRVYACAGSSRSRSRRLIS